MLKLIMEHNAQLKEMEVELEKLVKEKEQSKPMQVIPLSSSSTHRSEHSVYSRNSLGNSTDSSGENN
jgi:hypothetical protein